ncbi:thiosulfate oxidation carrier protein SoxY [Algicella marina]|nr:thiosulfate oxidation carrier protein SoxY [Algicella marina]
MLTLLPEASAKQIADAIDNFTGGAQLSEGGVDLAIDSIAENGFTVPVEVFADNAVSIAIFADDNPDAEVVVFTFGQFAGKRRASTRMRLARSQNVIAIAQMADGTYRSTAKKVAVIIGGCGA